MAIHFLCGRPGGGKGVVAIQEIVNELVNGSRVIVTDLPLRLHPWVRCMESRSVWNPRSKTVLRPEKGLLAYLQEKYGQTFHAEERIFMLHEERAKEFYLNRYANSGGWSELQAARDDKDRVESFDTRTATAPCLIVTDECWRTFGARDWANTGKGVLFYAAQHRKFGDEWFLVCQHTKQIETALRQVAQDYWLVKNHSKMRVGMFRQPDVFTLSIYSDPPTAGAQVAPMSTKMITLDKVGLGSCYDTAAGTGITGGNAADLNEKKRGLNFKWLIAIALLLIGVSAMFPSALGKMAGWLFSGGKAQKSTIVNTATNVPPATPISIGVPATNHVNNYTTVTNLIASTASNAPSIKCVGYMVTGSAIHVMFDDGEVRTAKMLKRDGNTRVIIDNKSYELAKPETEKQYADRISKDYSSPSYQIK